MPAPEDVVGSIAMIASETAAEISRSIQFGSRRDASQRNWLDKNMRRLQNQASQARQRLAGGIEQSDRGAVTVADKDGFLNAELLDDGTQDFGLGMEISDGPWQRRRTGSAVTGSGIDQRPAAGRLRQLLWEVTPQRDAAQAFMEKDQRGRSWLPRFDPDVFELAVADAKKRVGHCSLFACCR